MTSRLIVNQIRHTGASADAITMDSSGNVTFPANATCSGTATGFGTDGITMADSWKLSNSYNLSNDDYIQSGWVRHTGTLGGNVGSAMSEGAGVFAFPTTGLYHVELNVGFYHGSSVSYLGVSWRLSTDGGGNYSQISSGYVGGSSGAAYDRLRIDEFFDVTNASDFKMRFQLILPSQTTVQGGDGRTTLKVIKYGET